MGRSDHRSRKAFSETSGQRDEVHIAPEYRGESHRREGAIEPPGGDRLLDGRGVHPPRSTESGPQIAFAALCDEDASGTENARDFATRGTEFWKETEQSQGEDEVESSRGERKCFGLALDEHSRFRVPPKPKHLDARVEGGIPSAQILHQGSKVAAPRAHVQSALDRSDLREHALDRGEACLEGVAAQRARPAIESRPRPRRRSLVEESPRSLATGIAHLLPHARAGIGTEDRIEFPCFHGSIEQRKERRSFALVVVFHQVDERVTEVGVEQGGFGGGILCEALEGEPHTLESSGDFFVVPSVDRDAETRGLVDALPIEWEKNFLLDFHVASHGLGERFEGFVRPTRIQGHDREAV